MKKRHLYLIGILVLPLFAGRLPAATAEGQTGDWQTQRLMQPSPEELNREQAGHIMIYDGLTDRQVAAAMDRHFDRIGSMMFTGTRVTDAGGEPQKDADTGEYVTEDDGCD